MVAINADSNTPNTELNQSSTKISDDDEIYNNLSEMGQQAYLDDLNNPNQPSMSTYGVKKTALVYALRYGGKALSSVTEYLNKDTAKYLSKNADLIADTLESVSSGFRGAVVQALISVGVPHSAASTIGWAIEKVRL